MACGSALGVVLGLAAAPAVAQTEPAPAAAPKTEAAAETSTDVQEVVVVGSRIRRDVYNSPSPVQVISRDESTLAGLGSTASMLQSTAVTGGGAQINDAFGSYVTTGGPGANTLSLRGLGPSRTLVMLNGRRVSPAGSRGSIGSADLNVLPNAIVDRVDILQDGASSVYGSDAVAGVVNILTRSNVEGLAFEGQYSATESGGGDQLRLSVVGGGEHQGLKLSGSVEYYERADLTLADRDWTRCNVDGFVNRATGGSADFIDPMTGKPKCYPVSTTGSNGSTINTIGTSNAIGIGAPGSVAAGVNGTFNRWRPNAAIGAGVIGFEGVGGGANNLNVRDTFDPRMLNRDLLSPVKTWTGYLQGSYEMEALGDAEAYFEVLLNNRTSTQVGYRQLSLDYYKGSPLIPASLAFSTFQALPTTLTAGRAVGVRAFVGWGNYDNDQDNTYQKYTGGLRGDFTPLDGWRYDVFASFAKSSSLYGTETFLTDRMINSLDVVAAPVGMDPTLVRNGLTCRVNITDPSRRCVSAPPLNTNTIAGRMPADWVDYVWTRVVGETTYTEATVAAVLDGDLFTLPAGKVKGAFGLEFRGSEIDDTPSNASVTGNMLDLTSSAVTRGKENVWELYGEVDVPILANLPWAEKLNLSLSARYTHYDTVGADTTYKVGLLYQANDWLMVRGGYGTSFRAPALFEQFLGATTSFGNQSGDPCNNYGANANPVVRANCASEIADPAFQQTRSLLIVQIGGEDNDLQPETSTNASFGVVLTPRLPEVVGDFSMAIDYFNIEIDNGVSRFGASNLLSLCYTDPGFRTSSPYCGFSTRNADNSLRVDDSYQNLAKQTSVGIDYNVRYTRDIGPGSLRVNGRISQFLEQGLQVTPLAAMRDQNGIIAVPEFTGSMDVTWNQGPWRVRYGMDWIAGMESYSYYKLDKSTTQFDFDVGDYFLHSLSVRYAPEKDWSLTAGVRNLADTDPPVISAGQYNRVGNSPLYSGYDYAGRTVFVNLQKSF